MNRMWPDCWAGAAIIAAALAAFPLAVRAEGPGFQDRHNTKASTEAIPAEEAASSAGCTAPPDAVFNGLFRRLAAIESGDAPDDAARRMTMFKAFDRTFSTEPLARAALGRYWNDASDAVRERYLDLFHFHFMENYLGMAVRASASLNYVSTSITKTGEATIILEASPDSDATFGDLRVRVAEAPCGLVLLDVETGAWSLAELMHAEFRSIVGKGGIEALLARLEEQAQGSAVWRLWQEAGR